MLERETVIRAFHEALQRQLEGPQKGGIRPRSVALRAHAIYCAILRPDQKRPSPETFRKFATGRLAIPEVVELLKSADVRATVRARLDRQRLRAVFQEAIQRLETRLFKGQARPLQIARRAHEIYTREVPGGSQPSPHTFQRLIYGKAADPEIMTLIESALKKRG
jgi:hypothetical protein